MDRDGEIIAVDQSKTMPAPEQSGWKREGLVLGSRKEMIRLGWGGKEKRELRRCLGSLPDFQLGTGAW